MHQNYEFSHDVILFVYFKVYIGVGLLSTLLHNVIFVCLYINNCIYIYVYPLRK